MGDQCLMQPDFWATFNTKSLLGEARLRQKKYADAESLLNAGYKGLKQRQDQIPAPVRKVRLTEALARLVVLHEATGNKRSSGEVAQGTGVGEAAAVQAAVAADAKDCSSFSYYGLGCGLSWYFA
jgi:hypothetical protein